MISITRGGCAIYPSKPGIMAFLWRDRVSQVALPYTGSHVPVLRRLWGQRPEESESVHAREHNTFLLQCIKQVINRFLKLKI